MDSSLKHKKDAAKEPEEVKIFYRFINTLSRRAKTKPKPCLWCGLTTNVRYRPKKLNYRVSQNELDIRWSHKVYQEYYENLGNWTKSRRKKFKWTENLVRNLPVRFAITITLRNSDHVTIAYTYEIHGDTNLQNPRKINHVMYMNDIKLFAKNGKELETLIKKMMIYKDIWGMLFCIEKCTL